MSLPKENIKVHLSLGSNEGKRMDLIQMARYFIQKELGDIIKQSHIYEAESWGVDDQELYLNQVLLINTVLDPIPLLSKIHEIESTLGRKRNFHWSSRTIDIDILTYGMQCIKEKDLVIPHQLMTERKFVLIPLCDISPNIKHPKTDKKYCDLLDECKDKKEVIFYHGV